jgi:hypothetical protein
MKGLAKVLGLLLVAALVVPAFGRTATPARGGSRIYDTKWLDINKWRCPFINDGRYGYDASTGSGQAGGSWPQPFENMYIFGAGLWFGSLKPNASIPDKVDTLVTFGYNPNSGGTEMTPTVYAHEDAGAGSSNDRIFMYPSDWPPAPRDWWVPAGDTVLDKLVPTENFSLQDLWCAYSDVLPENHISPGKPQGIEIYQTVYAWNYPANQDIFFIIYQVRNAGTDTLRNCYMGAVMDCDIGDAADDMVGLLLDTYVPGMDTSKYPTVKNVGYAGDNNNAENAGATWEQGTPGVFAYKFLESPKDPDGRSLGMTAFKKFTIDIDPVTDPTQYMTMAGYDYRTGVYSPYDSVDLVAADKRFIQCSGPFDLYPGQVEKLIVAAMCAPYGGPNQQWNARPLDSLVHLANTANNAQYIYDQGWLLPSPPLAPNTRLIPGDNQVRIVWDNLPEVTPDPYWVRVVGDPNSPSYDPRYLGYDFQGYMLYRSRDGSNWSLLSQWDREDTIPRDSFNFPPGGDTLLDRAMWIRMKNTGLRYTFTDNDVTNGFTYYYCVAAYDWNLQSDPANPAAFDTLILRSGLVSNLSTVPRWEPVNFVQPTGEIVTASGDSTAPALKLLLNIAAPYMVTTDVHRLAFGAPVYDGAAAKVVYPYTMLNNQTGDTVFTGQKSYTVNNKNWFAMPVFNGFGLDCTLNLKTPTNAFDTIFVTQGSYPPDKPKPRGVPSQGIWAFRGSSYRIEWTDAPGYLTCRVYDLTHNGLEVPYVPFDNRPANRAAANGWCFTDRIGQSPSDTLKRTQALIHIAGGYVGMNGGDTLGALVSSIGSGDIWTANGARTFGTAPAYNEYLFLPTPGVGRTDSAYALNVKVVPNPYIVFNGWERSSEQRAVKFTHLPHECTIRIYTTSGDLVKVIEHNQSATGAQPLAEGGTATWDFTNESPGSLPGSSGQLIASGVYVWHVDSPVGEQVGKLVFIH